MSRRVLLVAAVVVAALATAIGVADATTTYYSTAIIGQGSCELSTQDPSFAPQTSTTMQVTLTAYLQCEAPFTGGKRRVDIYLQQVGATDASDVTVAHLHATSSSDFAPFTGTAVVSSNYSYRTEVIGRVKVGGAPFVSEIVTNDVTP